MERALENLRKYPLEERLHLEKICHDELSDLYMLCKDKRAEEQIGQCIDLHRKWLAMDDRFERPHRDTTGYMMRAYAKMVYLRDLISRDKLNEYYQNVSGWPAPEATWRKYTAPAPGIISVRGITNGPWLTSTRP